MTDQDKKRLEEIRKRVKDVQSRKERMGVGNLTLGYTQDFAFLLRLLDEEREEKERLARQIDLSTHPITRDEWEYPRGHADRDFDSAL